VADLAGYAGRFLEVDLTVRRSRTIPPRFFGPLPSGPYKGQKVDKEEEQQLIQEAFQARGWDSRGIPTSETLDKLGMSYLDAPLNPYR